MRPARLRSLGRDADLRRVIPRLLCSLALGALALLGAPAGAALAASCDASLTDASGRTYTTNDRGATSTVGAYLSHLYFTPNWYYDFEGGTSCSTSADGQEVLYPERSLEGHPGVQASLRVRVPAAGTPFVRTLLTLRNTTRDPLRVPVWAYSWVDGAGAVEVAASADGDWTFEPRDEWAVLRLGGTGSRVALVTHGGDRERLAPDALYDWTLRAATPLGPFVDGLDEPQVRFLDLVVPAGGSASLMQVAAVRSTTAEAHAAATALAAGPDELFAGLGPTERTAVRNFGAPDRDLDGVPNLGDVCPDVRDPAQGDEDRDGVGDLCDPDRDGDGLDGDAEERRGTDPALPDSDRDGVRDREDACPREAGRDAGCPARGPDRATRDADDAALLPGSALLLEEEPELDAETEPEPELVLAAPKSLSWAGLRRSGVRLRVGTDTEARVAVRLIGTLRGTDAFNVVLQRAELQLRPGRRTLRLRVGARALRALRRNALLLSLTGTHVEGTPVRASVRIRLRA